MIGDKQEEYQATITYKKSDWKHLFTWYQSLFDTDRELYFRIKWLLSKNASPPHKLIGQIE